MKDNYASEVELLTALHTIQEECRKYDVNSCSSCPFWISEYLECGVQHSPYEWDINDMMTWRAFK